MFHIIPEAFAVTRKGGIYKQTTVYQHNGRIFVKEGSGYVYVYRQGTSIPKLHIDEIILPFEQTFDSLGRMVVPENYNPQQEKKTCKHSKQASPKTK